MNGDENRLVQLLQLDRHDLEAPAAAPVPPDTRDRCIAEAAAIHHYLMTQRLLQGAA